MLIVDSIWYRAAMEVTAANIYGSIVAISLGSGTIF
jgi:hypothetical protein